MYSQCICFSFYNNKKSFAAIYFLNIAQYEHFYIVLLVVIILKIVIVINSCFFFGYSLKWSCFLATTVYVVGLLGQVTSKYEISKYCSQLNQYLKPDTRDQWPTALPARPRRQPWHYFRTNHIWRLNTDVFLVDDSSSIKKMAHYMIDQKESF